MPVLQEQTHSLLGAAGSLPGPQLICDPAQQMQNHVSVFLVLQLDAVVLGRNPDTSEPVGEARCNRTITLG